MSDKRAGPGDDGVEYGGGARDDGSIVVAGRHFRSKSRGEQGRDAMQRHHGLPGAWATLDQQHPRGAVDQGTSEAGRNIPPPFRATTARSAAGLAEPLWQQDAQILLI